MSFKLFTKLKRKEELTFQIFLFVNEDYDTRTFYLITSNVDGVK